MMTTIYDLAFEVDGDQVCLEQSAGCGEVDRVTLHRVHVRHLAEIMGLCNPITPIAAVGESDCTVRKLEKRLRVLRDRCVYLAQWLVMHSDSAHADLSFEQTYAEATADIADAFILDLSPGQDGDSTGTAAPSIGTSCPITSKADAASTIPAGRQHASSKAPAQLELEAPTC